MKKAILFLYFAAQFIASNGQTVSISCNGGGAACFTVEPCLGTSTYFATIDDGNFTTANGYTRVINWTPTPGASTDPIGNGSAL